MSLNNKIYKVIRPLGGLPAARFLARRHPRILMYHRLSDEGLNGALTPGVFRKQMQMINNSFNTLTLSELIDLEKSGKVPDHSVVITFDDGYEDFARFAFPILKEFNIPVTLFVTTGFVNGELWLWPDQIRYAIESTQMESTILSAGLELELDLESGANLSWALIADYCLSLDTKEKKEFISNFFDILNVNFPSEVPYQYRPLNWSQIRDLISQGVEIGSHSHSHPIMTNLNFDELKREIEFSKYLIERNTGKKNMGFCYPNGQPMDFGYRESSMIRQAGYDYAVSAFPHRNPLKSLWSINRYPTNSSLEEMEKTIYGLRYLSLRKMT